MACPEECEHWSSLSHVRGKAGSLEESVAAARKALVLNEGDPRVLNVLGWTLTLAGCFDEARRTLERAVAFAPAGYERPRNNRRELEARQRGERSA